MVEKFIKDSHAATNIFNIAPMVGSSEAKLLAEAKEFLLEGKDNIRLCSWLI